MDPLLPLEVAVRLPYRKIKRTAEVVLGLAIAGWAFRVPIVHPFIQSVLDERAERWADAVMSALN